ncbi:MAG: hypothetical protein JWN48_4927 [Myxococcaceae bacterium]|nr:hypothetical protein [Myxococcaceae bacterium]
MEELLGVALVGLLRVVGKLLLWLLKLAVQLILLVATGKWHKFGRAGQPEPSLGAPRQQAKKPARPARDGARFTRRRTRQAGTPERTPRQPGEAPWPFEFAPEMRDDEPESEAAARVEEAELAQRRARAKARAKLKVPAVVGPRRSLAAAVRDRQTVRAALLLGAALGPRRPRY